MPARRECASPEGEVTLPPDPFPATTDYTAPRAPRTVPDEAALPFAPEASYDPSPVTPPAIAGHIILDGLGRGL